MGRYAAYTNLLLQGLWVTVQLTAVSAVFALLIAIMAGVARNSRFWWVRAPVTVYVELFRGTSCYVQLFWFFYALPLFGITLTPFVTAVLVLSLNVGSFGSEVVRGALKAVPRGQLEAALALNYSHWQTYYYIQFPQAMRIALPPTANLLVDLLKITPLTSLVTIADLTYNSLLARQQTGNTIVTFSVILVMYFILSSIIIWIVRRAEKHFARGGEVPALGGTPR